MENVTNAPRRPEPENFEGEFQIFGKPTCPPTDPMEGIVQMIIFQMLLDDYRRDICNPRRTILTGIT